MYLTNVLRFWTKINPYKLISLLIKEGKFFSQEFINKHYNTAFKYQNSLGLSSFGELIIYNCSYAFDPCFEVLKKNLYKLISPLRKEEKVICFHITSLITVLGGWVVQ